MLTSNRKYLNTILSAALAAGILLTGCGGGGTTAGTGGGGSLAAGGATSTVVLHVPNGIAAMLRERSNPTLFSNIAKFLIETAEAAAFEVYMDEVLVGTTDETTGILMFPATPGLHTICFLQPTEAAGGQCFELNVEGDAIMDVTITSDPNSAEPIEYLVSVDPVADDVVDPTDPDKPHKVLVCHKNGKTLSVGADALPAHEAHGDTPGPCDSGPDTQQTTSTTGKTNNGNRGKNKS